MFPKYLDVLGKHGLVVGTTGAYWGLNSFRRGKDKREDDFAKLANDFEKKIEQEKILFK